MMHDIAEGRGSTGRARGGKIIASKSVALLSAMYRYAGLWSDNPCRGIEKFADGKKERRLSDEEFALLGQGLRKAVTEGLPASEILIVKFLALTGWRSFEARLLKWSEIDLRRRMAMIPPKMGAKPSVRPLSKVVCELLNSLPREGVYAFPRDAAGVPLPRLERPFGRIIRVAKLPADISPHTLRHSFASVGGDLDYSDPTIGAIIGHANGTMTGRYRHAADPVVLAAADRIANRVASLMGDGGTVVELRPVV